MKILALNGSPRRGNTARVLEAVLARLAALGHSTELVDLGAFSIGACRGCYLCVLKGAEFCPLKDDAGALWSKLAAADGVVLGAPVYALGVPGGLKNFMDRVAWNAHRPSFFAKPAVLVATTAGMGTEKAFAQLKWFEIAGLRVVATLGRLAYPGQLVNAAELAAAAAKPAAALDRALRDRRPRRPGLLQVIQFYGLKLNCEFGRKVYTADYVYYRDKRTPGGRACHPLKTLAGRLVYALGLAALRRTVRLEAPAPAGEEN
jgi:multimeric flavodoxin WrbA